MDVDPTTLSTALTIAGVLAATLVAEIRLLRRELKVFVPAVIERSRRRDQRQRRRESMPPGHRSRGELRASSTHDAFEFEEDTDIHVLMEQEREQQRSRRKTGQHRRPSERSPRPGTRSDKPFDDD